MYWLRFLYWLRSLYWIHYLYRFPDLWQFHNCSDFFSSLFTLCFALVSALTPASSIGLFTPTFNWIASLLFASEIFHVNASTWFWCRILLLNFLFCSFQNQSTVTTNDIVINKLTQILSYLRQGVRANKKLKKKDKDALKGVFAFIRYFSLYF